MILQACLNGARPRDFHPQLPVTEDAMVADARACIAAGANELHVHPRSADGRESLAAVPSLVRALRRVCPGTLFGVSTGDWIEPDAAATRAAIEAWDDLPDYASVNLSEPDAPAVIALLRDRGVGVEAGLADARDAERLLALDPRGITRVLLEPEEDDTRNAAATADAVVAVLATGGFARPVLLHGYDATVWPLLAMARRRSWSTRIGLEDGDRLPDGSVAADNTALVRAAVAHLRG